MHNELGIINTQIFSIFILPSPLITLFITRSLKIDLLDIYSTLIIIPPSIDF